MFWEAWFAVPHSSQCAAERSFCVRKTLTWQQLPNELLRRKSQPFKAETLGNGRTGGNGDAATLSNTDSRFPSRNECSNYGDASNHDASGMT